MVKKHKQTHLINFKNSVYSLNIDMAVNKYNSSGIRIADTDDTLLGNIFNFTADQTPICPLNPLFTYLSSLNKNILAL